MFWHFCFPFTDDFYQYELDDLPGSWETQPHLRLLRQVTSATEEPPKKDASEKKSQLLKDKLLTSTNSSENSNTSNKSIAANPVLLGDESMCKIMWTILFKNVFLVLNAFIIISEGDSSNMTEATTIFPSMMDLNDTQQVDYDGKNVSVTNTTLDHHRYYNRWHII